MALAPLATGFTDRIMAVSRIPLPLPTYFAALAVTIGSMKTTALVNTAAVRLFLKSVGSASEVSRRRGEECRGDQREQQPDGQLAESGEPAVATMKVGQSAGKHVTPFNRCLCSGC